MLLLIMQYSLILFIILVVMLVGGILGYVFREKVRRSMEQEMNLSIKLYKEKRSIRRAWDDTQENVTLIFIYFYLENYNIIIFIIYQRYIYFFSCNAVVSIVTQIGVEIYQIAAVKR